MSNYNNPLCQEDLLKYLSGEISFETWLDHQEEIDEQPNNETEDIETDMPRNIQPSITDDNFEICQESASIFSSWGSAFTSFNDKKNEKPSAGLAKMKDKSMTNDVDENHENEMDVVNDDYNIEQLELPNKISGQWSENESLKYQTLNDVDVKSSLNVNSGIDSLQLPQYEGVAIDKDNSPVKVADLIPIMKAMQDILKNCSIKDKPNKYKRKYGNINSEGLTEEADIMKDFQDFRLRKRVTRNRLPELMRMQMGQANLLVAKGDFKQAADICMEVVKEAPSCGQPFKTLSFIYDEQGDKEMSLQYSLIAAFLDCRDPQEWRELAKKCREAGNIKQTFACYDRACKVQSHNIPLQWERANFYFEYCEYRKCLDIYQIILKLLIPKDQKKFMDMSKQVANLYHRIGSSERAGEALDAAFSVCPNIYNELEALEMLTDIHLRSKRYKKLVQVLGHHTDIRLPEHVIKSLRVRRQSVIEENSAHNIKRYLAKTNNDSFSTLTSTMAKSLAESAANGSFTESLQLVNRLCSNSFADDKENFTTLLTASGADEDRGNGAGKYDVNKNEYFIPENISLEMRCKLAESLIHCIEFDGIPKIIQPILDKSVKSAGELILRIANAYFDTGCFKEALQYLSLLVEKEKYHQAETWLKIAECYDHVEDEENCIHAYYQVLSLAPLQVPVRFKLSALLRKLGRENESITLLAEYEGACKDEDGEEHRHISDKNRLETEEYASWYEKCMQMYTDRKFRDFLYHSYILMHNYLLSTSTYQKKQVISKAHMWELLLKVLNISIKMKEYKKAISMIEQAMSSKPYGESKKYRLDLDYLLTTACFVSGEYSKAFDSFRILLMHESDDVIERNSVWDLFAVITNKMLDKRHHRFTLRLLFKKPKLISLIIQNGNNSHLSGTYKYAIGEFSRAFREWPTYPLNSLLLAVSFLHLSCQKFHQTRHTSILHGLIFMFQYLKLREENQEAYYNMGRAFHQIGLVHFAVYYYNKALQFPLHNENKPTLINSNYHPYIDLHREAAYNLSLIYRMSGNHDLARDILYRYCWV